MQRIVYAIYLAQAPAFALVSRTRRGCATAMQPHGEDKDMASDLDGLGYRGKTVVVTGGASGMGEAAARILGDLGAHVHIIDIQEPKVPHAGFHRCDLSDFDQVRATAEALKAIAPIHFLFPCAGL